MSVNVLFQDLFFGSSNFGTVNGIDFAIKLTNRKSEDVAREAQEAYSCESLTTERVDALRKDAEKPSETEQEVLSRVLGIPKECLTEMSMEEREKLVCTGMHRYTILDNGKRAVYKVEESEFWEKESMNHMLCPQEKDGVYYLPELVWSFQEQVRDLRYEEEEALLRMEDYFHDGSPDKQIAGKKLVLQYLKLLDGMLKYRTCWVRDVVPEKSNQVDVLGYALAKVFDCEFSNVPEGGMETTATANAAQINELAGMIREFLQTKLTPPYRFVDAAEEEPENACGEPSDGEEPEKAPVEYVCTEKEAEKRLKKLELTKEELRGHADALWNEDWRGVRALNSVVVAEPQIFSVQLSKKDELLREYLLEQIRLGKIA